MRSLRVILLALFSLPVFAENSVVIGKATTHFSIDAEVPCAPPDIEGEHICMDAWIGFKLRITRTIAGRPISGSIKAARVQHSQYNRRYLRRLRLFVLQPVPTAELRQTLGVDYLLLEAAAAERTYCFRQPPDTYTRTKYVESVHGGGDSGYCFELMENPQ